MPFTETTAGTPILSCLECGKEHEGTYSHEGLYGEGPIFAVICTDEQLNPEQLTDYYTEELLVRVQPTRTAADLGLELTR